MLSGFHFWGVERFTSVASSVEVTEISIVETGSVYMKLMPYNNKEGSLFLLISAET